MPDKPDVEAALYQFGVILTLLCFLLGLTLVFAIANGAYYTGDNSYIVYEHDDNVNENVETYYYDSLNTTQQETYDSIMNEENSQYVINESETVIPTETHAIEKNDTTYVVQHGEKVTPALFENTTYVLAGIVIALFSLSASMYVGGRKET